jgi:hypothetical protein
MARASLTSRCKTWASSLSLWFDNLMRPVALPVSGGIVSALVLFSLLVPSLSFSHNFRDQTLYTDPDGEVVVLGPAGTYFPASFVGLPRIERPDTTAPEDANVVWLTIDETGRVSDYSLTQGKLTPDLESIIMLSKFKPATFLGMPTKGKVKVVQPGIPGLRS